MEQDSIAVIYLCWIPYGLDCFNDFISSYLKYEAGIHHELIITFKTDKNHFETSPFLKILTDKAVTFNQLNYEGSGLDVSTYLWCAQQINHTNIFFVNSRSRILASNWLFHFYTKSKKYPNTVFAATGSWQSYFSAVFINNSIKYDREKPFKENIAKYKLMIKAATLWWLYFPFFPNAHIRTNAFYINRQLFSSIKVKTSIAKIDAYRFESGRNSFTKQLKKQDCRVAILSKTGEVFNVSEWPESKIFWSSEQENLLIADNQTDFYFYSDEVIKKTLQKLAWNK